jgi:hypothetical protein
MRRLAVGSVAVLLAACGLELAGSLTSSGGSGAPDATAPGSDAGAPGNDAQGDASGSVDAPPGAAETGTSPAARRKALAFTPAKIAGPVDDFPVWLDLVDADLAAHALADGRDIFFTAQDGTALSYALQSWDVASGHLTAWVKVPHLTSAPATSIYLRYGDAALGTPQAPAAVFSAGFAAVWHLEDALTGTAIADATGTHDGIATNLTPAQHVLAKLGGGVSFTGGTDEIGFTNPFSGNAPHTVSLWVSQRATTDDDALVVVGNGTCGQSRWLHAHFGAPHLAVGFYCNDWGNPDAGIDGAGWKLLHWVFEGTNNVSRIYEDGALVAGPFTHMGASAIATQGAGGHLANAPVAWGPNMGAHATLDEVRLATVARSAAWIATEFANQGSPSTFTTAGPEEPAK